jgi:hypothetical protein
VDNRDLLFKAQFAKDFGLVQNNTVGNLEASKQTRGGQGHLTDTAY